VHIYLNGVEATDKKVHAMHGIATYIAAIVSCIAVTTVAAMFVLGTMLDMRSLYGNTLPKIAAEASSVVWSPEWLTTLGIGAVLLTMVLCIGMFVCSDVTGSRPTMWVSAMVIFSIASAGYTLFYGINILVRTGTDCAILSYCNPQWKPFDPIRYANRSQWDNMLRHDFTQRGQCTTEWGLFVALVVFLFIIACFCSVMGCLVSLYPDSFLSYSSMRVTVASGRAYEVPGYRVDGMAMETEGDNSNFDFTKTADPRSALPSSVTSSVTDSDPVDLFGSVFELA
jgi:hypothetical protein